MSQQSKIYVPGCYIRSRETQFGEMLSVSLHAEKLVEFAKNHADEKGYLNLTIAARKEPKEGITHNAWLDTFKPSDRRTPRQAPSTGSPAASAGVPPDDGSDVPFDGVDAIPR